MEAAHVRSIHLVDMSPHEGLAVIVLSNQIVEKLTFDMPAGATPDDLVSAGNALSARLTGKPLSFASRLSTGNRGVDAVIDAVKSAHKRRESVVSPQDHVFVGGTARVADAFEAVDTVRRVLGVLEHQYVVVGLLRDVLSTGRSVAIGTEHGVAPLAECAVVVAPITIGGQPAGTVGVLGPTRMNYPHALAAVTAVSRRLGENLAGDE
jgi:heat-inducible transcriptional repressor